MTRETLHQLVEDLDERDFRTADRLLRALRDSRADLDPLHVLDTAPEVDEPEDPPEQQRVLAGVIAPYHKSTEESLTPEGHSSNRPFGAHQNTEACARPGWREAFFG